MRYLRAIKLYLTFMQQLVLHFSGGYTVFHYCSVVIYSGHMHCGWSARHSTCGFSEFLSADALDNTRWNANHTY